MSPLWNILGTTLGVVSSRLGEDYVNACTESVEEVIVDHYKKQINFLKIKRLITNLKEKLKNFVKKKMIIERMPLVLSQRRITLV